MNSDSQTPRGITLWIKMLSAVVGAGVVIAMSVLTVAVGGNEAHADPAGVCRYHQHHDEAAPQTPFAEPNLKAPPWRCW